MFRIALAQVNLTVGDIKGNTAKVMRWVDRARRYDADLVAFPELAISGYPAEDLLLKRRFLEDCRRAVETIAAKIGRVPAVVGFPHLDERIYNAAAVMAGGRVRVVCSKIHLPNYGVFDEKRYFLPGKRAYVVRMGDFRIGINICEDIWREDVAKAQVRDGKANVIINISSSPYHAGKGVERERMLIERAVSNNAHVCYVNLVGGQDELVFDGHSVIIDAAGRILARGRQFREDLVVADINLAGAKSAVKRRRRDSAARIPVEVLDLAFRPRKRRRKIRPRVSKPMDRLEEIYTAILTGTRDYVRKNGFRKVVVGLSGGIDSALVAVMAVDALGAESVVGVSMPSRFSSADSITDARKLARNLGIRFLKVSIEEVFSSYLESLKSTFRGLPADVTEENIQARVRGNILMALSNKFGWLVLTTGNKSELGVGYCTLYGDLAGGFAILKDVPKTLVYDLACYRNSRGGPVIPQVVLSKSPSAELRPNQKDEDSLPPYEILDPVLSMYVVDDMAVDEIVSRGYPRRLVRAVARLVDGNEYKRRQGPPGIKITPKAFGKDRRMPITNRYH